MMMIQTGFYALWLAMFGRIVITGDLQVDLDSDNHCKCFSKIEYSSLN